MHKYIINHSTQATVLLSAYPAVEVDDLKEDITTTLQTFLAAFEDEIDPANNCKIDFQFLDDFVLNTEEKLNGFFFLTTLIKLPDRLKNI